MRTSFIPYFGLEGLGWLELDNEEDENVPLPILHAELKRNLYI